MIKRFFKFFTHTGNFFDMVLYIIAIIALLALFLWIDSLLPTDWIYIPSDLK